MKDLHLLPLNLFSGVSTILWLTHRGSLNSCYIIADKNRFSDVIIEFLLNILVRLPVGVINKAVH